MDFAYLNAMNKKALSGWVDEVFAGKASFLFDLRKAADEDFMGDQISKFWGNLTEAANWQLVEIYRHPDGPHVLDVRRPTGKHRWGSMQQIELAMLYGHLEWVRYFDEGGGRFTFSVSVENANTYTTNTSICRAEPEWATLAACRSAIDRILRLNPAHSVEVVDVTLGPSHVEQLDAELMESKAPSRVQPVDDSTGPAKVINIDKNLRNLDRPDSDSPDK